MKIQCIDTTKFNCITIYEPLSMPPSVQKWRLLYKLRSHRTVWTCTVLTQSSMHTNFLQVEMTPDTVHRWTNTLPMHDRCFNSWCLCVHFSDRTKKNRCGLFSSSIVTVLITTPSEARWMTVCVVDSVLKHRLKQTTWVLK